MKLPDKIYDILKWLLVIVCPAVVTALVGLSQIYGWAWADVVIKTIPIVQTFLGAVFCISCANYNKDGAEK